MRPAPICRDPSPRSRNASKSMLVDLEPVTCGVVLRTPTPKDRMHFISSKTPPDKLYSLDPDVISPQESAQSSVKLPALDRSMNRSPISDEFDAIENNTDLDEIFDMFSRGSSKHNLSVTSDPSQSLKKVFPPITSITFKGSYEASQGYGRQVNCDCMYNINSKEIF